MIQSPRLSTVGAVCAISTVACFVLGGISMGSSGVQLLIPETGQPGREWVADVDAANGLFFVGAWLIVLMGFLRAGAGVHTEADPGGQVTLAATFDTFTATALVINSAGNFLGFGVAVPIFAGRHS